MTSRWVRRVLVVEDQSAMRALICESLERHGFEVRGAADAATATRLFAEFDPDVLLTDVDLGSRPSGAELAAGLAALAPHLGIVFLSSYPRAAAGSAAWGIERAVFVSKQTLGATADLIEAIEATLHPHPTTTDAGADPDGLSALTRHQMDVLAMVARGWSNDRIATQSGATTRAVERSISRIFDRLGLSGDASLSPRVAAASMYHAAFGPSR